MKEKYMKPCLVTESFELTQSIATDCGVPHAEPGDLYGPNIDNIGSCSFGLGNGMFLFNSTSFTVPCNLPYDEEIMSTYCYNNPVNSYSLFGS